MIYQKSQLTDFWAVDLNNVSFLTIQESVDFSEAFHQFWFPVGAYKIKDF